MAVETSEAQRLLRQSVERLLADRYGFAERRRYAAEPEGWSREMWRRFAELGLLSLPFPEGFGGLGGAAADLAIVMECFGRALVLEPYLATVVLGGGAVAEAGSTQQRRAVLPHVAAGELVLAFAHAERQSRYNLADVNTRASDHDGHWVITGEKFCVLHGDAADKLVVSARTFGKQSDPSGLSLFLVDADQPGLSRRSYLTHDGLRAADVHLDGVRVEDRWRLGAAGQAASTIERVTHRALAAICAEAVGLMDEMLRLTVEYLKTRQQFGVPIGSFQVLQHRAVDMLIAADQARSMALLAGAAADSSDADQRRRSIAAAKIQIGRAARLVGQQAVQLHGGVGLTMEYKVAHCFLRSTAIEYAFGDADHHLAELAALGGLNEDIVES